MPEHSGSSFSKYRARGAYHWTALSRLPWRHHCYTTARYRAILEAAQLVPGERVLDLGCGDGVLIYLATQRGAVCSGVEPDEVGRSLAMSMLQARGISPVIFTDISQVPDASQECVLCAEVIEHVTDAGHFLEEIHRVLIPGGRVVLSTPVRLTETPLDREHVSEFSPGEFRDLCSKSFAVTSHDLKFPVAAVELYYWRPWFFLHRPVIAWLMNIMCSWFGFDVMGRLNIVPRYQQLQILVGRKR